MVLYWWRTRGQDAGAALGWRSMEAIEDFKKRLLPIARLVEGETGISAKLGVTQAALESAYGTSKLSTPSAVLSVRVQDKEVRQGPANNIFGFKTGDAWTRNGGAYVLMPTKDYYSKGQKMPNGEPATADNQALLWPAPFRAYASWEESYRDWARLMQTAGYIADGALDALKKGDMYAFGIALSKRYAPNQGYEKRLAARAAAMGTLV